MKAEEEIETYFFQREELRKEKEICDIALRERLLEMGYIFLLGVAEK